MEAELVIKALNRALILRRINPSELVIHTDQGSQYTGSKYQKLLIENKSTAACLAKATAGIMRQWKASFLLIGYKTI